MAANQGKSIGINIDSVMEKAQMYPAYAIVAMGSDRSIGRGGDLIWHLPADLKHFKATTMGHPVIMGRRTWESLPKGALPGRRNIVVSRNPAFRAPGAETALSPEEALAMCRHGEVPFIIGGAQVYAAALRYVGRLYITRIDSDCADADARFPELRDEEWTLVQQDGAQQTPDGTSYRFEIWERRKE